MQQLKSAIMLLKSPVVLVLAILILQNVITSLIYSFMLLPELVHNTAIIYKQGFDRHSFNVYNVEEYVDWHRRRSTTRLSVDRRITTYYNQITSHNEERTTARRLVAHYANSNKCADAPIQTWPLADLRSLSIHMLPSSKLTMRTVDVALGPAAMLVAIEENLDRFQYQASKFSLGRLSYVDIYTRLVDEDPAFPSIKFGQCTFRVVVRRSGGDSSHKISTNLGDAFTRNGGKLNILSASICKKVDKGPRDRADGVDGTFCGSDGEAFIHVEYLHITEFRPYSLIGNSIENEPDPRENPFALPIGIGCFGKISKTLLAPKSQFSGLFTTTNSSMDGLVYVAFDGAHSIFRLDRSYRRDVYDLEQALSYHTTDTGPNPRHSFSELAKNCIILRIRDPKLDLAIPAMERLLGISSDPGGDAFTHYLGSRTIDHVNYEIYERELLFNEPIQNAYNLPILLEPADFEMPGNVDAGKRYFVSYYVSRLTPTTPSQSAMEELKFIELWEYGVMTRRRRLINRLTFAAFSTDLSVRPPDGDGDFDNIFTLPACSKDKSQQTQLRFRVSQRKDTMAPAKDQPDLASLLRDNIPALKTKLLEQLVTLLEIPRPSFNGLQVELARNTAGDLIVETNVVDLGSGVQDEKFLDSVRLWDLLARHNNMIKIIPNRHSLDDCRLDSLQDSHVNWFMHCPELATCVLLERDQELRKKFTREILEISDYQRGPLCAVYQIKWARKPVERYESVLQRIEDSQHKIDWIELELDLTYQDPQGRPRLAKYEAHGHSPVVRSLGQSGVLPGSALLTGLRYTTMREEPGSINMNARVELSKFLQPFQHCQRACQLDDFCGSFSICSRRDSTVQESDCILSTMSLTNEKLASLAAQIGSKSASDPLELKFSTKFNSQVIIFRRDESCSLHPKGLVDSFEASWVGKYVEDNEMVSEPPKVSPLGPSKDLETSPAQSAPRSLEECARECHESSLAELESTSKSASFAYCAFDSLCFLEVEEAIKSQRVSDDNGCFVYQKRHTQFYENVPLSRAVLKAPGDLKQHWKTSKLNYSQKIYGLSADRCAQDCSSSATTCLAFNWCGFRATPLCELYSIRSPKAKVNARVPLLPLEKQMIEASSDNGNSVFEMSQSLFCQHFYLKDEYFEIRLQQLQSHANEKFRDEKIKKAEREQLEQDVKESERLSHLPPTAEPRRQGPEPSRTGRNIMLFLVGLALGCVGVLYGEQASSYVINLYKTRRRYNHANQTLSHLSLTNDLEL